MKTQHNETATCMTSCQHIQCPYYYLYIVKQLGGKYRKINNKGLLY